MTPIWTTRDFNAWKAWGLIACSKAGQNRACPMRRFCVEVLSALTRSTHFCNGDEGDIVSGATPAGEPSRVWRGFPILAQARFHLVWRTEWPDCDHAHRASRKEKMDRQFAFPACPEFLHVASRPGSDPARDLHWLALASHLGRYHRRRAFRDSINLHSLGLELHLCRIR